MLKFKKSVLIFCSVAVIILIIIFMAYEKLKGLDILLIDDFEGEISVATVDYGAGSGSQIEVSFSQDVKYHGEQAVRLKYNSVSGGYMWLARGYQLDVKGAGQWLKKPKDIDWSKYKAISFYMLGENSKADIAVDIIDADFEYFRFMVKDDFVGWKQIICPFEQFFARGDWQPTKAKKNAQLDFPINAFQFEPRSITQGTLYFDYVHLIKND